ncbi:hypothetical protein VPH35_018742 [Triticum aestivum]
MPRLYSHPVVHPHPAVVAAPPAQGQMQGQQAPAAEAEAVHGEGANGDVNAPPGVIMSNRGKRCRPGMRLAQAAFAAAAAAVMASTHGFASVTAFRAMIFSAACGSAGITVLLDNDLRSCPRNHCPSFMTATAMAFLCWFVRVPSGITSLWRAVYEIQRS